MFPTPGTTPVPPPALPSSLTTTPPSAPGLTNSVPFNVGMGTGLAGSTNFLTHGAGGDQLTLMAVFMGFASHFLLPDQPPKWMQFAVLLGCSVLAVGIFLWVGHLEPLDGLARGMGTGVQALLNMLGVRITGVQAIFGGTQTS